MFHSILLAFALSFPVSPLQLHRISDRGISLMIRDRCPYGAKALYAYKKDMIILCKGYENMHERGFKHELVHAAQDCKAGQSIDKFSLIYPDRDWPDELVVKTSVIYSRMGRPQDIPIEIEAAGLEQLPLKEVLDIVEAHCPIKAP